MSETIATKAAAEACETTPRLLRQFLRASNDYQAVGSGGRYAFEADDLPTLKTRFDAWVAEREAAAKARAEAEANAIETDKKISNKSGDDFGEDKDTEGNEEAAAPARKAAARRGRTAA